MAGRGRLKWTASRRVSATASDGGRAGEAITAGRSNEFNQTDGLRAAEAATSTLRTGDRLAIVTQPAGAVDGAAFTTQPVVQLRDATGDVRWLGRTVSATIASGTGALVGGASVSTDANGRATFANLGIDASAPPQDFTIQFASASPTLITPVTSATVAVQAAGGYAAPDIYSSTTNFNSAANDSVWNTYNPNVAFPGGYQNASPTGGRGGTRCLYASNMPADAFNRIGLLWSPARSRVFVRFYFRTSTFFRNMASANIKWIRFHGTAQGDMHGGLHGEQPAVWFDQEGQAIQVDMGWWWGACPAGVRSYYRSLPGGGSWEPQFENRADGQWHSIEIEYDRNAGTNAEYRLWMDNQPIVLPNGASNRDGGPNAFITMVGGNAATDTPTTFRIPRSGSNVLSGFTFFETISQPLSGADMFIDDVAVSTQRIGP